MRKNQYSEEARDEYGSWRRFPPEAQSVSKYERVCKRYKIDEIVRKRDWIDQERTESYQEQA
jgi:hypothetical protein